MASVGATMPLSTARICNASHGIPVIFIQGTADPAFPWNGATIEDDVPLSVNQTISTWRWLNRCPNDPIVESLPDTAEDGTQVQTSLYESCRDGSEVMLFAVYGGGIPGRARRLSGLPGPAR